jgi:heptosyltransferase-2
VSLLRNTVYFKTNTMPEITPASSAPPKKILIIGPAWIGDMVMAQSLFQLLRQAHPKLILHVLAPGATYPLLQFMPEVDQAILFETQHGKLNFWKRVAFGFSLRKEKYDQTIVLTNSWKSAILPFFAKIRLRTGWLGEQRFLLLNDIRRLDKEKYPFMHQRFAALGLEKGVKLPELGNPKLFCHCERSEAIQAFNMLEKLDYRIANAPRNDDIKILSSNIFDKPILALCPGAEYGPAKRWPAEYYAIVAEAKIKEGWQVWLLGSPKESEAGLLIQEKTQNGCVNLIGKTKLAEAIYLLSFVAAVVCNDSGLMHIAAALDKPLIAIFGSSSPTHTPPLSNKAEILYLKLECSPCFKRECPLGHLNCLKKITPEKILEKLKVDFI